mgnify:CR=1 FL=1
MRKSYVILALIAAAAALALTGCDALFQNQFKAMNLGQPDPAKLAEQANSSDPVVAQTAQVTLIEQKLQQTDASQIVASINVAKLTEVGENPNQLINAIIPASLQGESKKDELAAAINSLVELKADIDKLADLIKAGGATEAAKDQLQTALLVTVLAVLEPAGSYTSVGDAVAEFVNAGESADPAEFFKEPDLEALKDNDTIKTLLEANNFGSLEDFFSSFNK